MRQKFSKLDVSPSVWSEFSIGVVEAIHLRAARRGEPLIIESRIGLVIGNPLWNAAIRDTEVIEV
jgi:hypothetical protein